MPVDTIRPRIVAMLKEMAANDATLSTKGIKVYDHVPRTVQAAFLPAFIVFTGASTDDTDSMGDWINYNTRQYRIVLLVENAAFNAEYQAEIQTDDYFDTVRDWFQARPGLELDASDGEDLVFDSQFLGDQGYKLIPYPDGGNTVGQFAGTEFRLQVREVSKVSYKD